VVLCNEATSPVFQNVGRRHVHESVASSDLSQYVWFYQPMTQQLTVGACLAAFADSAEHVQIVSG